MRSPQQVSALHKVLGDAILVSAHQHPRATLWVQMTLLLLPLQLFILRCAAADADDPQTQSKLLKRMEGVKSKFQKRMEGVKNKFQKRMEGVKSKFQKRMEGVKSKFQKRMKGVKNKLQKRMEGVKSKF
ncbi:hypothetical protein WMY93_008647 [Mugilogobius chulae]|uniref:Uncharacterized protein n=1 Tax=Mugilogobius chulae TaxID=88201 RepID=A0AAW0PLB3_9GOBI